MNKRNKKRLEQLPPPRTAVSFDFPAVRSRLMTNIFEAIRPFLHDLAELDALEGLLRSPLLRDVPQHPPVETLIVEPLVETVVDRVERELTENLTKKRAHRRTKPKPKYMGTGENPESYRAQIEAILGRTGQSMTVSELVNEIKTHGRGFTSKRPQSTLWPVLADMRNNGLLTSDRAGGRVQFALKATARRGRPKKEKPPQTEGAQTDVVLNVLREHGREMDAADIARAMAGKGYHFTKGVPPARSVGWTLNNLAKRNFVISKRVPGMQMKLWALANRRTAKREGTPEEEAAQP